MNDYSIIVKLMKGVIIVLDNYCFIQFGLTALHYASRQNCVEYVRELIEHGADVDIKRKVTCLYNCLSYYWVSEYTL